MFFGDKFLFMNSILVSGITFIKNGLTLGYPIKESIESIEPLCDEIIINVGFDDENLTRDDGTFDFLTKHFNHKKFIFLKSYWDPTITKSGLILSEQTNIALSRAQGKIIQYIQADEVIHENDYKIIHNAILEMLNNPAIEGLVYNYLHFYGNLDVIRHTKTTYRREVRTIKNGLGIKSYLDAQGFRAPDNRKPNCKLINASVYHYGWARPKLIMQKKIKEMGKLYSENKTEDFSYRKIWGLKKFVGTHPKIVQSWVNQNKSDLDVLKLKMDFRFEDFRLVASDLIENLTGIRLGEFKNYKLL